MKGIDEDRQRVYDQASAARYVTRHVDGEEGKHQLALELLVILARNAL